MDKAQDMYNVPDLKPVDIGEFREKEFWEIPLAEFVETRQEMLRESARTVGTKTGKIYINKNLMSRADHPDFIKALRIRHAEEVKKALAAGHTVPAYVLKDYPDRDLFGEMVSTALRWNGAALKADKVYGGDTKARLNHSRKTSKSDLDRFLIKRFGVDQTVARDVSNELTRLNLKPDMTATIEDFKEEPWADDALGYLNGKLTTTMPTQVECIAEAI